MRCGAAAKMLGLTSFCTSDLLLRGSNGRTSTLPHMETCVDSLLRRDVENLRPKSTNPVVLGMKKVKNLVVCRTL